MASQTFSLRFSYGKDTQTYRFKLSGGSFPFDFLVDLVKERFSLSAAPELLGFEYSREFPGSDWVAPSIQFPSQAEVFEHGGMKELEKTARQHSVGNPLEVRLLFKAATVTPASNEITVVPASDVDSSSSASTQPLLSTTTSSVPAEDDILNLRIAPPRPPPTPPRRSCGKPYATAD
ncbi:hypothetical protein JCM10213_008977 [Rhodosporidiobolus nylandii]